MGLGGGKKLAESSKVDYLGEIPMNPEVREAGDNGIPVVISKPDSAAAQAIGKLAERIAGMLKENKKSSPPELSIDSGE